MATKQMNIGNSTTPVNVTVSGNVVGNNIKSKGSSTQPVYFDEQGNATPIEGIPVQADVYEDPNGYVVVDAITGLNDGSNESNSGNKDWQLVDTISVDQDVVSVSSTKDYTIYNEVMIQCMIQPALTTAPSNNIPIKFAFGITQWSDAGMALTSAPKSTEFTSFGLSIVEKTNLGLFLRNYMSYNWGSVNTFLVNKQSSYEYKSAYPFYQDSSSVRANQMATDFYSIASSPFTDFTGRLNIGSYMAVIGAGSLFKIYGR